MTVRTVVAGRALGDAVAPTSMMRRPASERGRVTGRATVHRRSGVRTEPAYVHRSCADAIFCGGGRNVGFPGRRRGRRARVCATSYGDSTRLRCAAVTSAQPEQFRATHRGCGSQEYACLCRNDCLQVGGRRVGVDFREGRTWCRRARALLRRMSSAGMRFRASRTPR